jgi:hypothetical protein
VSPLFHFKIKSIPKMKNHNIVISQKIARDKSLDRILNTEPTTNLADYGFTHKIWYSYIVVIDNTTAGTMFFDTGTQALQYLSIKGYNGYIFKFWGSINESEQLKFFINHIA